MSLIQAGDLVKLARGASLHGIVLGDSSSCEGGIFDPESTWVWIFWPDSGKTLEKSLDVERVK